MSTTTLTQAQLQTDDVPAISQHPTMDMGFQDLARGDRHGKIKLQGIPTFTEKHAERQWMKEHMAAAFRFFGKNGYAEGIAGHISMRGMSPWTSSAFYELPASL